MASCFIIAWKLPTGWLRADGLLRWLAVAALVRTRVRVEQQLPAPGPFLGGQLLKNLVPRCLMERSSLKGEPAYIWALISVPGATVFVAFPHRMLGTVKPALILPRSPRLRGARGLIAPYRAFPARATVAMLPA